MFDLLKQEYKSAYRDARIFRNVRHTYPAYGDPPSLRAYHGANTAALLKDQKDSVGCHYRRFKAGKIDKAQAIRLIKLQYKYQHKLP